MNNKTKNILRLVPAIVIASFITMSAIAKLAGLPALVHHFRALELEQYLPMFGSMELTLVMLFLHPRTSRIGFYLLTAYFGGAIATELRDGPGIIAPLVFLSLVWLAAYFRNPALFTQTTRHGQPQYDGYASELASS